MSIIISKSGKNATKLERTVIEKEDFLQSYIADNPESLPLHEIKEDIRLLILAREFSVASGYIDALGVDADGEIYVIETKLYRNPDKRHVIAQMLDYGASLWKSYSDAGLFIDQLEQHAAKTFGVSLGPKLCEFYGISADGISTYLDALRQNISNGVFRFVVLMDRMDDRLKDLILFVNSNSRFDVLGVELEFYRHADFEIVIPQLYGAELKKEVAGAASSTAAKWDPISFFQHLKNTVGAEVESKCAELHDWCQAHDAQISWGKRSSLGGYTVIFSSIYPRTLLFIRGDGVLQLYTPMLAQFSEEKCARFVSLLDGSGFSIRPDYREKYVNLPAEAWLPKIDAVKKAVEALLES